MPERHHRRGSRWKAVLAVAAVLLVGSVLPSPLRRRPAFSRVGPDKLLHLVGHAVFAVVLADALTAGRRNERDAAVLSVGISTGYGVVMGRLQERIPGRAAERADVVAGFLGSMLGVLGWRHGYRTVVPGTGAPGSEPRDGG